MKIYVDTESITPSIFTATKTTFRDVYDHARTRNEKRLQPGSNWGGSDVLLYNDNGCIMEAIIFNVAFYRSSKWVTPSTNSGCLPGVMRRWLLHNHQISEDESRCLTKDSIQPGEWVLLFNGVQGCRLGKVYV
jgi:4-amino-4-deoxychorismate lyase